MSLANFHKTRLAPTPSGFLHLGNLYSFMVTAQLAKQTGANILLRIDDLDRERQEAAYVNDIFETLAFMGIEWQEGPSTAAEFHAQYSQVHRMPLYELALQQLAESGRVFACTCSRSVVLRANAEGIYPGTCKTRHLPLDTAGVCWRLNTEGFAPLEVKTTEGVKVDSLPPQMKDFVVRRKDGIPAYQLASVVDDIHFGIDLVVRGEDLWPSTLAQLCLAQINHFSTFSATVFYHHLLLTDVNGQKLSKSAGSTSAHFLIETGHSHTDIENIINTFARQAP